MRPDQKRSDARRTRLPLVVGAAVFGAAFLLGGSSPGASAAWAQDPGQGGGNGGGNGAANGGKPGPGQEDPVITILPQEGGWGIEDLFKHIHKTTGRSILYENQPQSKVKTGKVVFTGSHTIRESELFDWLQAVLSFNSLVLVPVGPPSPDGKQQWYCLDQANAMVKTRPVYIDEKDIYKYEDRDGLYVVTSVQLKHISDTGRVRTALTALATSSSGIGRVQDVPGSRAVILGDFAPVVAAMKRLLDYIDVQNNRIEPQMKVISLEHAVASELEPIITDLIQSSDQARNRPGQQQGAAEEDPEPKLIPDDRLDAIIVYATEKYMEKIETLIRQLDIPSKARGRLHFRPLKHTDATEMRDLLDDLIKNTASAGSSRSTSGRRTTTNRAPAATGGTGQPGAFGSGSEGQPVIIADKNSNSLIVHASPSQIDEIDRLIVDLDRRSPQVLIETALVEMTLSDGLQLGVEVFTSQDGIAVDTDGDGTADAITEAAKFFGASGFGLGNTITTDVGGVLVPVNRSPTLGTGFTAGFFKNGKLPVLLSAFQNSGRAKVVTRPGVVTNDNKEATINLKRTTSFRESVRTDSNTDRDSFKEVTAETTLTISPSISSDNYLRLKIDQTVANFGNRPSPDAPPDQTERSINTIVTVPDEYTVVIGGLIQEEERTSVRKVPILGDIPVIGFFFRQTEDTSSPSHLFLFVTPHILRDKDFEDLHRLTWDKKLESEDVFEGEGGTRGMRFRDPNAPAKSAAERLRDVQRSGALDAPSLKAPMTAEERNAAAAKALEDARKAAPAETAPEKR